MGLGVAETQGSRGIARLRLLNAGRPGRLQGLAFTGFGV